MGEQQLIDHLAASIARALEGAEHPSPVFAVALRYTTGPYGPADLDVLWADEAYRDEQIAQAAVDGEPPELLVSVEYPHDLLGFERELDREAVAANAQLRLQREADDDRRAIADSTFRLAERLQADPPAVALSEDFIVFPDDTEEVAKWDFVKQRLPRSLHARFLERGWLPDGV